MKRVFRAGNRAEAGIVCALLAEEGLESTILNEGTSTVSGDVPFFLATPEVWVLRDEDEERALVVVEHFNSGAARDRLAKDAWECPSCGEQIEGQFTACWKCESDEPS